MTDTKCEVELLDAIYNVIPNSVLEGVLNESMQRVGPPVFGPEEMKFAEELVKTFEPGTKDAFLKSIDVPDEVKSQLINETLVPMPATPDEPKGSTDVGDVSWCCPTAQFTTACNALGTPGHSWQYTAQAGGDRHAGMIAARQSARGGRTGSPDFSRRHREGERGVPQEDRRKEVQVRHAARAQAGLPPVGEIAS